MAADKIKLKAFGKYLDIERINGQWVAFFHEGEGKRREARDIVIPADLEPQKIKVYIDDLLHEWATEKNPNVEMLKELL